MSHDVGSNKHSLVLPTRTAVIVALVAALLLVGLLLLERSGPSPIQPLRNISSGQPATPSASGTAGQASIIHPLSAPTRLADASISGGGVTSQLTPITGQAKATCSGFLAGTATTLAEVDYDTKGTTISKVTVPGAFFYWQTVQAAGAGTQSVTVTQSTTFAPTTGDPIFELQPGSAAFDSSCNSLGATITGNGLSATISFTAPAAGTYAVAVEYMTHDIIGDSPASTTPGPDYTYTFSGSGASQTVTLNHV